MNVKDKKYLITLFIISVISFFSNIWVREADLMEQRNFITAREMVKHGNYLVTTLNGNLRFEKPPFPTWLTGVIMKLTNNFSDEWILRIPAALTGVLLIFLIYFLVKVLTKNCNKAFFSSFSAATMFMIIKTVNENNWDIYTYVFAFGGILLLVYGLKQNRLKYFIESGIFFAISIMSKGPVGLYGLVLPFLIAYIATYGRDEFRKNWKNILILIGVTGVLSAIWPLMMYLKYPDYFLSVMDKEEATWSTKHTQSFIFYFDYFIYTGIWIFFTLIALFKRGKEFKIKKYSKFLLIWNIAVLLLLSIISMKKKRYGIPIYMVSALNIGVLCNYYWNTMWEQLKKYEKILLYIQGGFITVVSALLLLLFIYEAIFKKKIPMEYLLLTLATYSALIYLTVFTFKKNKEGVGRYITIASGVFMLIVNLNANWFIDRNYVRKQYSGKYLNSKLLQKNPPILDIYSNNFDVDEVWDVGKEIKPLSDTTPLPESFILLGDVPEGLKNRYHINKNEIYSENDGDTLKLYYLNRKE